MPSSTVANMIQGVSLQQPEQRRYSQAEVQWDCINSPLDGCVARPPTEYVAFLPGLNLTNAFFHELERGSEHYLAYFLASGPGVLNLGTGVQCTLHNDAPSDGYLGSMSNPRVQMSAQAVDDYSFVAVSTVAPALTGTVSSTPQPQAMVVIKASDFARAYTVTITLPGVWTKTCTVQTKFEVDGTDALFIKTSTIAQALESCLNGNSAGASALLGTGSIATTTFASGDVVVTRSGNLLLISFAAWSDFDIDATDGAGDTLIDVFKGNAKSVTELPARGFDGLILKIRGADRSAEDDYWVRYTGGMSTGQWVETIGPNVQTTLNPATMPHVLINEGTNVFRWRQQAWSTRVVGDLESNPNPGFIGRPIRDMFYDQGRLGLMTDMGATWSKTNYPFTFFPDTVQTHLATEPIDYKLPASSDSKGPSFLEMAVVANENMYVWAQKDQRRVYTESAEGFKEETITVKRSTAFTFVSGCRPSQVSGNSLYWLSEGAGSVNLKTATYRGGVFQGETSLSEHVTGYIPSGATVLATSDDLRMAAVVTTGQPNGIFLYNYRVEGEEFVQSAWSFMNLPGGTVVWCGFKDSVLHIVQQQAGGVLFTKMDMRSGLVDPVAGALYFTRLDVRVNETQVAMSVADGQTLVSLPYPIDGGKVPRVVTRTNVGGELSRGTEYEVVVADSDTILVLGDLTGIPFYVGYGIYAMRQEGEFAVKDDKGVLQTLNGLTVIAYELNFSHTGYTRLELYRRTGPSTWEVVNRIEMEGHYADGPLSFTGTAILDRGTLYLPIGMDPKEYRVRQVNDSFLPSSWQSAKWIYEGNDHAGRHSSI